MSKKFLNENQAALKLGITKELLYSYVKTGIRENKLKVSETKRNILFEENILDKYESFLKEKWIINSKEKRPTIPKFIKEFLKIESNGQCARCHSGHRLDNAHIIPWSESFSHFHHNLIRLCTDCHIKYDDGIIPREEILQIKKKLIDKLKNSLIAEEDLSIDSLHAIPNPDLNFIGRQLYIKEIHDTIENERITILSGVGGIGKTELLIKSLEGYKQLVKWFKTDNFDLLQDLKYEILNEFNVNSIQDLFNVLDERDLILVFDGLEKLLINDGDKTLNFLRDLSSYTTKVRIIITTQINLDDYSFKSRTIKLKGLLEDESNLFLTNFLPEFNLDDLNWVTKFSNGHALTIILLIGLIRFYQDPKKVKEKLKTKGVEFINSPSRKEQSPKSSFNLSLKLSYEALDLSEQSILTLLTNFPGGCKDYTLEVFEKSSFVDDIYIDDIDFIIARLNQFNLIEKEYDPLNQMRITLLNPIKQFIISEVKTKSLKIWHQLKIMAFRNLMIEAIVIYQHNVLTERWEEAIWRYEIELPNYINAFKNSVHSAYCKDCLKYCDKKDYLRIITGFAGGLYKYLFTRGYIQYGLKMNEEGAKAHMNLGEYDLAIEDLTMLAQLYYRNNDFNNAEKVLKQMKFCNSKLKDDSKLVHLYLIEGEILRESYPKKAISLYKKGLKILSNSSEDKDFKNSNTALLNAEIGRIYEVYYRNYDKALEYNFIAYSLYDEIKDYSNLYSSSHHIGNCYAFLGEFNLAIKYYKESLFGFISNGQKQYIGNTLSELGRLRVDKPNLDYDFIDENVIKYGLEDIKEEIELTINTNPNSEQYHLNAGLFSNQIYKLWHIIKLISFSNNSQLMSDWAQQLLSKIQKNEDIKYSYPWFFLNIALLVTTINKESNVDNDLKSIKYYCYLYGGEVEHDIYDPFKWLALWLKYKEFEHTSRGQLFAEIDNI